ncbi:MAG: hypothetical protein HN952_06895 [Candidatus Cloacimonetes bacterium]|nr:hypothetical protein [Candidatus Cloacimonadota bacterium]MBT6994661.1 hypothetical protein [Candidatus Cloacimonadota bacterium]MBT7469106.1 hypothetical protein [Candidatus Cloacimonadota bacterium]
MKKNQTIDYLFENANPIIRYRIATELANEEVDYDIGMLRYELLQHKDAKYWMKCLKTRRSYDNIHGGYDKSLENSLGKLLQLGIKKGVSNFDKNVAKHINWLQEVSEEESELPHNDYFLQTIVSSFLAKAGFTDEKNVRDFVLNRLDLLYGFAKKKNYNVFIDKVLFKDFPPAFENHKIIDPLLYENDDFALPWIYDLFAFAAYYSEFKEKIDTVINYILNKKYQDFPEGYGVTVSFPKRFFVVGWNVWLPCFSNIDEKSPQINELLFRLNLMSPFEPTRKSKWYKNAIAHLEKFKTKKGTYIFPEEYLQEKRNSYFINASRMEIGEDTIENLSTFWMMKILNN